MLLKISKWLEIIAFKTRQKSLYFELKHYIKNNQSYFRKTHYWERGMGKSYTLVKLAKKFKCPIVVSNEGSKYYIQRLAQKLHIKNINIITCNQSHRGKKYDIILCEEGIDEDFIHEVLKPISNCLVGYINMDVYHNTKNQKSFQREYECTWIK